MSDDLEFLKDALRQTPPPAPDKKADHLARAMESFQAHQETTAQTRLKNDPATKGGGFLDGVINMFQSLSSRAGLTATTGIVAVAAAFIVFTPQGQQLQKPTVITLNQPEPGAVDEPMIDPEIILPGISDDAVAEPMVEFAQEADALSSAPRAAQKLAPAGGAVNGFGGVIAPDIIIAEPANTEAFANEDPNPVKVVADDPVSTFSIDVDTAAYGVVRSSLNRGQLPPVDAVRAEEIINYFPYAYPAPDDAAFKPTVSLSPTPWNEGTQLLHIALQGQLPALADRPPLNLVFLIDTSGSMNTPSKLPLLKQSFSLMLSQLRPEDEVAIVTYAGSAGQVLAPTKASDRATILAALERLSAGGSTAGQAGLQQAYALAETMAAEGEVNRVLLATDGDFNVGLSNPEALKTFIADKRDSGTYLSVLGFGRGNLDDATMQALAQNGNGQAAYIDTLNEAQKVLVDQLSGALFPIADDVKIQIEFNPAKVAEYRLIGYETRALRREDFNNDKVDAGEIGAGHSVTAIYEVTPVGSDAVLNDPLRYGDAVATSESDELGFLRLRYKAPGETTSQLIETPIAAQPTAAGQEAQFAFAMAGFAQLLTGATYLNDWGWDDAIALANSARGDDPFGYRTEAVQLMRLANSLGQ
ncbi:von Willebrand factor A [Actibacterium atlanticum]|uniref:von Willebrand factor A n=1 Tax=Actibacterium atlanticum TaxID=1461693 RepID=A0A058ZKR8_9RHOB|nr:VWA domain-containing protein [Actibacterium atlanticum]KCV81406.1 von Willebrand factor A [Actibacterium atlanticum]